MILLMVAQAARVLAGDPASGTDHTQNVAVVARFLAWELTDTSSSSVTISNRDDPQRSAMADFRAYAIECPIKEITAVPSASEPLPIAVTWSCLRFIEIGGKASWEERNAEFWVEGRMVKKVVFGTPPTVKLEDVGKRAERLRWRVQEDQ